MDTIIEQISTDLSTADLPYKIQSLNEAEGGFDTISLLTHWKAAKKRKRTVVRSTPKIESAGSSKFDPSSSEKRYLSNHPFDTNTRSCA